MATRIASGSHAGSGALVALTGLANTLAAETPGTVQLLVSVAALSAAQKLTVLVETKLTSSALSSDVERVDRYDVVGGSANVVHEGLPRTCPFGWRFSLQAPSGVTVRWALMRLDA